MRHVRHNQLIEDVVSSVTSRRHEKKKVEKRCSETRQCIYRFDMCSFPIETGHSHSISLETGMVLVLIYLVYFNTAVAAAATNSVIA